MSLESLFDQEGSWSGTYKLWFSPGDPHLESETNAVIRRSINRTCVLINYDWEYEDKSQEGLIAAAFNPNREMVRVTWFDSFHVANDFLACEGFANKKAINFVGSYSAPVGPAWNWRTIIDISDSDVFKFIMFNIHPDGTEELAVEAVYKKTGDA